MNLALPDRAEPQHRSGNSETRVMLVVRGLLLLLKQLVLALSQLPLEQFQDLPIPLQQLLAGCRLLVHTCTDDLNLASCLPEALTPITTVTSVETTVFITNMMRLWLAGVSHESPWSPSHMNQALLAFKEHYKAHLSHQLWKYSALVTLSLLWCVTENVCNSLLLRHLRSLLLHGHGKSVFVDGPCSVQVWCPKELKRSPRDITELDVVLAEFEKIAANYGQSIESNVCRKAINGFCSAFKDQITDLIVEVQELKNMKKKNAKVIADIKKKRQRLLQLSEELIGAEPQLIKLQREYAEIQERKSSLRQATELLTDLKELQQDCLDYREENPKEKVVYGTSSLPALLVESRRILGAEKHFQNINMKLEEALAVQRRKLSKKH